jgi:hypothetical protein
MGSDAEQGAAELSGALTLLRREARSLACVGLPGAVHVSLGTQLCELLGGGGGLAWRVALRAACAACELAVVPMPAASGRPPAQPLHAQAVVSVRDLGAAAAAALAGAAPAAPPLAAAVAARLLRAPALCAGARFSAAHVLAAAQAEAGAAAGAAALPRVLAALLRAGVVAAAGGGGEPAPAPAPAAAAAAAAWPASDLFALALPGGGALWAAVRAGRAAAVARVRRRARRELLRGDAEAAPLRGSPLPAVFHVRDAVGAGALQSVYVAAAGAAMLRAPA